MAEETEGKEIRLEQTHTALKPISTPQPPPPWAVDTARCSSVGRQRSFPVVLSTGRGFYHTWYTFLNRTVVSTSITPKGPPGMLCHLWLAHGIGPKADLLYSFPMVTDLDVPPPPRLLGDGVKFVCTEQAHSLFSDSQAGGRGAGASSMCDHQHPCAANSLPRWEVLAL